MKRRAFTLIEVLVVVAIIALLIAILMPSLARARELSARVVCTSNEHQLSLAWQTYTFDNKGELVGSAANWMEGAVDGTSTRDLSWTNAHAPGWVRCITAGTALPDTWSEANILNGIRMGALYKYVKSVDIYHCPATKRAEMITYGSSIPLNSGLEGMFTDAVNQHCWVTRMSDIRRPSERISFLDHLPTDTDFAWVTQFPSPMFWWGTTDGNVLHHTDKLSGRHTKGTVYAFCDGHAEYWRWTDEKMAYYCTMDWRDQDRDASFDSTNMRIYPQFRRLYTGIWGKIPTGGGW